MLYIEKVLHKLSIILLTLHNILFTNASGRVVFYTHVQWFHLEKGGGLCVYTAFINVQEVSSHPPTFVLCFHIRMP